MPKRPTEMECPQCSNSVYLDPDSKHTFVARNVQFGICTKCGYMGGGFTEF